jgi:hypothetical protein
MTGRRTTFVPSVPSQEHIEAAARLYKTGESYADSADLDVRKDYKPGEANLPVAVVLVGCGICWLGLLVALMTAVHL